MYRYSLELASFVLVMYSCNKDDIDGTMLVLRFLMQRTGEKERETVTISVNIAFGRNITQE